MNLLKSLGKKGKEAHGSLTGKTLKIGSYAVKVEQVLGEGGFATIYRVSDVTTRSAMALKHFKIGGNPEACRDVQTEVAVMKALRGCPHVLRLLACAFSGPDGAEEEAFMLIDLCQGNLGGYLQSRQFRLDEEAVLRAFVPVCRAVQAMHSLEPPLVHRDLKAENVLLHGNGQWVLCDFGSCTSKQQVYESAAEIAREEETVRKYTTGAYRAPEMWDLYAREFVGTPVDIWALGCMLYLLCFGRLPFDPDAKLQILNGRFVLPSGAVQPALEALLRDMLRVGPLERPNIDQERPRPPPLGGKQLGSGRRVRALPPI